MDQIKLNIKMKKVLTGLVLILALSTQAQDYSYTVKGNASETWVSIKQLGAELKIIGSSGSDIRIETMDYEGVPDKAKGLKPLNASGRDENTGLGLSLTQDGNTITITGANREANDSEYTIYLPKDLNLKVDYNHWQTDDLLITDMAGEVEAKAFSSDLELIDVTGPIIAHTLSSDLVVTFTSLSQKSPTSLTSTSGDIEITMPASVKGVFKMSSVSGGAYTDHDFDMGESEDTRMIVGTKSTGKLNGGGVEVSIRTISGDIYIRKSK